MRKIRICVLGAGVIGLGSALCIQELLEKKLSLAAAEYSLDVVAEQFSPNLTSDVAAGIWEPYADAVCEHDSKTIGDWAQSTWDYYKRLWKSGDAGDAGLQLVSGYMLTDPGAPEPDWKDTVTSFHALSPEELDMFPGFSAGYGFTTFICEQSKYLPFLTDRLRQKRVRFIQKSVTRLAELCKDYDLIVNCTGLGANVLLDDKHVIPIRGQVVRVKAPWVKVFVMDATTSASVAVTCGRYVLPNVNACVLGGTFGLGDRNLQTSPQATRDILENCAKLVPGIEKSEIISVDCGLRPARFNVRLERETIVDERGSRKTMVVHNYGHGGIGVTLHMGCCLQAAELANSFVQQLRVYPRARALSARRNRQVKSPERNPGPGIRVKAKL